MKKMKKGVAFLMAAAMSVSMFACASETSTVSADEGYAYMAIDINPTVEFVIKDGKVVNVSAVNDDAAILISSEDFVGKSPEEVSQMIVQLAEELGYLNDANASVKITVSSDDESYAEKVEAEAEKGAKKGSDKALVNRVPRSADNRKVKELKEENPELYKDLTPEKLRLIEAIMRYDETFTYEQGAVMTMDELIQTLSGFVEEYKQLVGEQLKEEFKKVKDELEYATEKAVAEIFGEDYLLAWEKYQALDKVYEAIEKNAEAMTISEEDVASIMQLLNIEDVALITKEDKVTVQSVDWYLDRHCAEDVEEAVETILEKYDEDEYILTEADVQALVEAYGEELSVKVGDKLEALSEIVEDLEESLKALEESLRESLSAEQKLQMHLLSELIKGHKQQAYNQMQGRIQEMHDHFHGMKEERRQQGGHR